MNKTHLKLKERLRPGKEIRTALIQCLAFLLGFFLTPVKFIFDIHPFSLALLSSCRSNAVFIFAGSLISIYFNMEGSLTYALCLCAIMAIRVVGSLWLSGDKTRTVGLNTEGQRELIATFFKENVGVRVAISAFAALGVSIYTVVISDFSYYEIFVLAFFTVVTPILTYALCGLYDEGASPKKTVAISTLSFMIIFALKGVELFGLDISLIFSYSLILYASKNISPAKSGAFGALLGISQDIAFAPIFAISAIASGFLWRFSVFLAIMSGFFISVGYGIFTSGYQAIVYLVPELLFSSLAMYPLLKFEVLPRLSFASSGREGATVTEVLSQKKGERVKESFTQVSDSLMEISKLLYDFGSNQRTISIDSRYDTCLQICESNCYSCPKRSICWDKDVSTTKENIEKMCAASFYKKYVNKTDIDEKFLHRCPNIDTIIQKINQRSKEEEDALFKNDKLEIIGSDFESISKMLSRESGKIDEDVLIDDILTDKVRRGVDSIGFICDKIGVYGGRKKRIIATGVDKEGSKCKTSALTQEIERSIGCKISAPTFDGVSPYCTMYAESSIAFAAKSAYLSSKAEKEDQNGDTVSTFSSKDNKFYMLICDGMGSGSEASATSKMCAEFLKRLLTNHPDKEIALSMANSFIRNKHTECSSSVDLFEIDLANGKGCFIKSGAAPSFIKREDKVFKLTSKTAPIGIMKSPDAEQLDFDLREDDMIAMVSDGICASEEDIGWICELLSEADTKNIDTLPKKIIERAKERGVPADDRSVSIAIVKKAV